MQTAMPEIEDLSRRVASHARALRARRSDDGQLRPPVPAGPAVRRAGRAVRAGHAQRLGSAMGPARRAQGRPRARTPCEVDRPIAGLADATSRPAGLLDDTLVLWGGEFGRTPTAQGKDGRDHNPEGFTMWLAGGGVKPGFTLRRHRRLRLLRRRGQGPRPRPARHAFCTCSGLDHERLTYRYAGRDFRLTDVAGQVAHEIIA